LPFGTFAPIEPPKPIPAFCAAAGVATPSAIAAAAMAHRTGVCAFIELQLQV
jgi:hypothetical protein